MSGFLDPNAVFPYCPGCGHPHVLKALDRSLEASGIPVEQIVLVTDIGCVGLADAYFPTLHTVHTLHGRATAVAAGMELASRRRAGRPVKPVVLVGDGGATIGLLHLVHAAQLDVDVTVVVHNNLVYGMTGGQHSGLTPQGFRTTTTPEGSPIPPLDLGQVLAGAGVGFFGRVRVPRDDVTETLTEAIRHPGFACVEALELCPTFASRVGGMTGKGLDALAAEDGREVGIVRRPRPPIPAGEGLADRDPLADRVPAEPAWARLDRTVRLVVAGRAGERVQSAAKRAGRAAMAAGLHVSVRTDNPVTQGRGFSLAELTISPEPIAYTGLVDPDLVVAVGAEGWQELARRGATSARRVVVDDTVDTGDAGGVVRLPLRKRFGAKGAALGALAAEVEELGWWSPEAWEAAGVALP